MGVGLDTSFSANPLVQAREVGDGAILLDSSTGDCFELNRSGAEIWRLATEGRSPEQIVTAMSSRYGLAHASAESDVLRTIDDLVRRGLLVEQRR